MNREIRFRIDSNVKYEIDDAGFLRCDASVTRAGIFNYYKNGKLIRELRPKEEVFKQDSLDTLKTIPITDKHPKKTDKMVTVENVKKVFVGTTGENVRVENDFVTVPVVLYDKDIIAKVIDKHEKGENIELSCGYKAVIVENPGSNEFGFYDTIQKNIKYNHISIVENGRAGRQVKLKLDNKEVNIVKFVKNSIKIDSFTMDEIDVEIEETAIPVVRKLSHKIDEAVKVIDSLNKEKNDSIKKIDALQAQADQYKEESEKLRADVSELSDVNSDRVKNLIKDKSKLYDVAEKFKIKTDGKDDKSIKIEIVKLKFPAFDSKDKSDDYINSRFDGALELIELDAENENNKKIGGIRKDNSNDPELSPREKFMRNSRDMWKIKK